MIERKEINSRFYLHNERLAKSWEDFTQKYNGDIQGLVNSFCLEFSVSLKIDDITINIQSLRQRSNNTKSVSLANLMTKNTVITIHPFKLKNLEFSICKSVKLKELFLRFTNICKPFSYNNEYTLISKVRINENEIINLKFWNYLTSISEIREISLKNNTFKIEYFNFLGDSTVEELILKIKNKYGA